MCLNKSLVLFALLTSILHQLLAGHKDKLKETLAVIREEYSCQKMNMITAQEEEKQAISTHSPPDEILTMVVPQPRRNDSHQAATATAIQTEVAASTSKPTTNA